MTTVLLADDTPTALELLTLVMQCMGCTVLAAKDGAEAIQMMKITKPDIAFLDLSMPVVDGFAAIQELRRLFHSSVPVYAVSAHCKQDDLKNRALASGALGCICKPIEIEIIEDILRRHNLV